MINRVLDRLAFGLTLLAFVLSLPASGYVQLSPVTGGFIVELTDAPTIAWDVAQGYAFKVTLGGNRTMGAPTGAVPGTIITLQVFQDGTGSRTLDFTPQTVKFPNGELPSPLISSTASSMSVIQFLVDGAGNLVYLGHQASLEGLPAVPAAPTGFTATLNGANIDFAWTDNSDNETEFEIQLENPPGTWAGALGVSADAESHSEPAATFGGSGTYNFRVVASNGEIDSDPSNEDDVTVP